MFIQTQVISWLTKRDGKSRISALDLQVDGGRVYLLNCNRIRNQRVSGAYTQFDFYDILGRTNESPSIVVAAASMAQLSTCINTAFPSKFVTLPFYKYDNPDKDTENVTFTFDSIAFADSYRSDPTKAWVIYYEHEFKRRERLCAYSLDELDILGGGTPVGASITWDSIVVTFDSDIMTFDSV